MSEPDVSVFSSQSSPARAQSQLRLLLALFLIALTIPLYFLLSRVYQQLENESLYQYRNSAEELVKRVNARLQELLGPEDDRPFDDYSFLKLGPVPLQQAQALTYSPLAEYPPKGPLPGIVGYFQVNPDGALQSPILPKLEDGVGTNMEGDDLARRVAAWDRLSRILTEDGASKQPFGGAAYASAEQERVVEQAVQAAAKPWAESRAMSEQDIAEVVVQSRNSAAVSQLQPEALLQENEFKNAQQVSDLNLDRQYLEKLTPKKAAGAKLDATGGAMDNNQNQRGRRKETVSLPVPLEGLGAPAGVLAPKAEAVSKRRDAPALTDSQGDFDRFGAQAKDQVPAEESALAPKAASDALGKQTPVTPPVKFLTLEGEIDPLQFRILDNLHLLFVRKVWRSGQRYLQGFVLQGEPFFQEFFSTPFQSSNLSQMGSMIVGYQGIFFRRVDSIGSKTITRKRAEKEIVLYRNVFEAPFDKLEVLITAPELPAGPGAQVVNALAYALGFVILAGLYGFYRIGVRYIVFAKERSDFVSAVSHELKTPLTSIRMYSEMLRDGWVKDEEKKRSYYSYILGESERLSRLIANVLQFAKLTNSNSPLEMKRLRLSEVLKLVVSKTRSQIESSGFELETQFDDRRPEKARSEREIEIEEDAFCRIAINLVDNALKFSAKAEQKKIVLGIRTDGQEATFFVRDFGPGVPREQMKKIFQLFYRAEDEMNRSTPGTGIGLALVKELAQKMSASVDLKNTQPGAEFSLKFKTMRTSAAAGALENDST